MPSFGFAPLKEWQINPSVPPARRARLLDTISFESIVARLCREARVLRIEREEAQQKTKLGLHRYTVTLGAKPRAVDLWHNSRGGYRAQFYLSPTLGNEANVFALNALGEIAAQHIQRDPRRKRYWVLASKSVCHLETRIWIGQGLWLRHAKRKDRLLCVPRWRRHDRVDSDKVTSLRNWGALIPAHEHRLVLKGQWLEENGLPAREAPKANRAEQINRYGFT